MTQAIDTMTVAEAIAALPDGDDIHSFVNPSGILVGADWSRRDVEALIRGASEIRIAGPMAQGMKHGIAIVRPNGGGPIWFATRDRTDGESS